MELVTEPETNKANYYVENVVECDPIKHNLIYMVDKSDKKPQKSLPVVLLQQESKQKCLDADMKLFAEIRTRHREKKAKQRASMAVKSIHGSDDLSDYDDWLDDEQWYCEHVAQWTGNLYTKHPPIPK